MGKHEGSEHAGEAHDVFDPTPVRELAPGEPRTPLWLPAVGAAFFAVIGLWWVATGDDDAAKGNVPGNRVTTTKAAPKKGKRTLPVPPTGAMRDHFNPPKPPPAQRPSSPAPADQEAEPAAPGKPRQVTGDELKALMDRIRAGKTQ